MDFRGLYLLENDMRISERADPQLKLLYRWESANGWDDNLCSFFRCGWTIHNACELYRVPQPMIKLHTTRNLPWSCPSENIISMQRDKYLNVPISLHETSHHIVYHKHGARPQDHGPTFLRIYLDLLIQNGFNMYKSANAYGLRW